MLSDSGICRNRIYPDSYVTMIIDASSLRKLTKEGGEEVGRFQAIITNLFSRCSKNIPFSHEHWLIFFLFTIENKIKLKQPKSMLELNSY